MANKEGRKKDGTFAKGWKGGPGRPKKEKCITDSLRRIAKCDLPEQLPHQWQKIVDVLEPLVGKPKTFADLLAFQYWWDALDGNDKQAREIVDRLEGRTAQPLVGDPDNPIVTTTLAELAKASEKEEETGREAD